MIKHLKFYLLHRIVKDPVLTSQIYNMIYHRGAPPTRESEIPQTAQISVDVPETVTPEIQNPSAVKKFVALSEIYEVRKQLDYLKSKSIKSKQDKDSIGILEAVLKNKS